MNLSNELHILVTPIGNLKDISINVIDHLKEIDYLYAEDTRKTNKILSSYSIKTINKLRILNDINEERKVHEINGLLNKHSVGIISDAGYPTINDPGYKIIQDCVNNNIKINVIGTNSAILSSLIISGFESNEFSFHGYLNFSSKSKAKEQLQKAKKFSQTTIFFLSKHDINKLKSMMLNEKLLLNREVAIVKEVTKIYQKVYRGFGTELFEHFPKEEQKGEFVFLIRKKTRKTGNVSHIDKDTQDLIDLSKGKSSKKHASKIISKITGVSSSKIYKKLV